MPWSWTSPAKAAGKGTGNKGGSGGGSPKASGSGGAAADSLKAANETLKKQIAKMEAEKKAAAKAAADAKKHWTCTHCGDTRCFVTRKDCHQCGKPRQVPTPPGLEQPAAAAAAAAVDQETVGQAEVPLEERIAGF